MKTILCYGDSNTWGYNPATGTRYGRDKRWPGVLRNNLGSEYLVIEEGLCGRTTVWDDPIEGFKSGEKYLIPCLETHKPVDLVVLFLGTNDLKGRFSLSAADIAQGAGTLVDIIQRSRTGPGQRSPEILLLAPPPVGKLYDFAQMFTGAEDKSKKLAEEYRLIAREYNCKYLNTAEVIRVSDFDGIHLELDEHRKLGEKVAGMIRNMFVYNKL